MKRDRDENGTEDEGRTLDEEADGSGEETKVKGGQMSNKCPGKVQMLSPVRVNCNIIYNITVHACVKAVWEPKDMWCAAGTEPMSSVIAPPYSWCGSRRSRGQTVS